MQTERYLSTLQTLIWQIDIKNAFPSADHRILLSKLKHYGVRGNLYKWFDSYLSSRTLTVDLNGVQSQPWPVTRGVPQGSALGPLLFSIYINDIVFMTSSTITLFADDMELHVATATSSETVRSLNVEMAKLKSYMDGNGLELNVRKTVCMFPFTAPSHSEVSYDNAVLSMVSEFKYLGIWIDSHFTWQYHVHQLISKVQQRLHVMYRSRYYCKRAWRRLLFTAYVKPYFLYGIAVWYASTAGNREKVELLYRHCLRIILNDTGIFPLLARIGVYTEADSWPLSLEFQLQAGTLLYGIIQAKAIPAQLDLLPRVNSLLSTRTASDATYLQMPLIRHERMRVALTWWGPKLWNTIPSDIRQVPSKTLFAMLYATYLSKTLYSNYELHCRFYDFV